MADSTLSQKEDAPLLARVVRLYPVDSPLPPSKSLDLSLLAEMFAHWAILGCHDGYTVTVMTIPTERLFRKMWREVSALDRYLSKENPWSEEEYDRRFEVSVAVMSAFLQQRAAQ